MSNSRDTPAMFGPYQLFERLGMGGMASVHRAIEHGTRGEKIREVALKRLLPHLAEDESFVRAFAREAKLASLLSHENIVGIHEFGRVKANYFISMELIEGRDLRKILRQAKRVVGPPPINVVVALLVQVCDALEYAHSRRDEDGKLLGIVHRDISPSNLIVTRDGLIKLIDFGIARAQSEALRTNTGRIKGKLAYMAPEASQGKPFDARSDLFSVGVIAHELLSATPLFAAKNDYETLMRVQQAEVLPPSALNPKCPPELDAIVLKALAKDRNERITSARELREALRAVRRQYQLASTKNEVANWLRWAFAFEDPPLSSQSTPSGRSPISVPQQVPVVPSQPTRPMQMQMQSAEPWKSPDAAAPILLEGVPDVSERIKVDLGPKQREDITRSLNGTTQAPQRWPRATSGPEEAAATDAMTRRPLRKETDQKSVWPIGIAVAVLGVGAVVVALLLWPTESKTTPSLTVEEDTSNVGFFVEPAAASILVNGKPLGDTSAKLPAGEHEIKVTAPGYRPWNQRIKIDGEEVKREFAIQLLPETDEPAGTSVIVIKSRPRRLKILIDGKDMGVETPATVTVPSGDTTITLVHKKRGIVWNESFVAEADKRYTFRPKIKLKVNSKGSASSETKTNEPVIVEVEENGKSVSKVLAGADQPTVGIKLPTLSSQSSKSKRPSLIAPTAVTLVSGRVPYIKDHGMAGKRVTVKLCIAESGAVNSVSVRGVSSARVKSEIKRALGRWKFTPYRDSTGDARKACFLKNFKMQ